MNKRKLVRTVHVDDEELRGRDFYLDYYLLEKELKFESISITRYGVEIFKRAKRESGTPYAEYRKIFDVFSTEGEAWAFLELLARNQVTPISLKDILEDVLGITEFAEEEVMIEAV